MDKVVYPAYILIILMDVIIHSDARRLLVDF